MITFPGVCPHCKTTITHCNIHGFEAGNKLGTTLAAVQFICPNGACKAVLGIATDPLTFYSDIKKLLKR